VKDSNKAADKVVGTPVVVVAAAAAVDIEVVACKVVVFASAGKKFAWAVDKKFGSADKKTGDKIEKKRRFAGIEVESTIVVDKKFVEVVDNSTADSLSVGKKSVDSWIVADKGKVKGIDCSIVVAVVASTEGIGEQIEQVAQDVAVVVVVQLLRWWVVWWVGLVAVAEEADNQKDSQE
jgi:hypothetical protein